MNIVYIEHYAGTPALGMEFRPYYLAREWVRAGHRVQILAASYSHVRARQPAIGHEPADESIDGIGYRWYPTSPYQGNGLGRVRCHFDCRQPVRLKDPAVTGHLYRIAQEAVNNALKHAHAGRITVRLNETEKQLRLEVKDDGGGLPPGRTAGLGLGLMRHRASVIGASLAIESKPGGGVTITCLLPRRP